MIKLNMFPLSDSRKTNRIPFVTWGLILINVLVFIMQLSVPDPDAFILRYALTPSKVDFNQINTLLPFVTSMFMHGGFMHIISNMWFLAIFGDNTEDKLGPVGFFIFYMLGGFVASLAQYLFSTGSSISMLGASGAVAAVLGFYIIQFPTSQIRTLIFAYSRIGIYNVSAKVMLGVWALTQFLNSIGSIGNVSTGGVAWFAHIGGFIFGVLIAFIVPRDHFAKRPEVVRVYTRP